MTPPMNIPNPGLRDLLNTHPKPPVVEPGNSLSLWYNDQARDRKLSEDGKTMKGHRNDRREPEFAQFRWDAERVLR